MKKLIFIPLLFIISSVLAQESNSLIFRVGMGTYSMKTQKNFQEDYRRSSIIRHASVHSFPAFPTFGGSAGIKVSPSTSIGLWGEYSSTGGRLHYQDYSGYSVMDQVLSAFQIGPFMQTRLIKSTSWPVYFTLHSSIVNTKEKLSSDLKVGNQSYKETYNLKSLNYSIRPGIMLAHSINSMIFQLGVGSELQLHGTLKDEKKRDLMFRTSDGKDLTAQWDGMRVTFGIGFKLE